MQPSVVRPLAGDETIAAAREVVSGSVGEHFLVTLGEGRWSVLSREALMAAEDEAAPVRVLLRGRVPRLYQDQSLDVALRFLKDRPMLPVVDRGNLDRLMGVVSIADILGVYRRAGLAEPETVEVS